MKWTVGRKIGAGFTVALAVLVIIGMIAYRSTNDLTDRIKQVEKTDREIILINDILISITESETGVRGYLLTGKPDYLELHIGAKATVSERMAELSQLMAVRVDLLEKLQLLKDQATKKLDVMSDYVRIFDGQGQAAALAATSEGAGKALMDDCRVTAEDIKSTLNQLLDERQTNTDKSAESVIRTVTLGIPLAIVLISISAIIIIQSITKPLKDTTVLANRISQGDLSLSPHYLDRQDEIGELSRAFSAMIVSFREMNLELISGVNIIASSSSEIMASTAQVASTAMETSAAISETTSSVEEVKQSAQMAAEKARTVSDAARETVHSSESGLKSVEQSINGMNRIQGQVESIAQSLISLSEQSQAVGEIIASVNELAEQSNLLAVNAAIEAAKAGEQGKGFAVVAQEVKMLAEQSKEATAQVRKILSDILKAINSAVLATELGSKAVEAGTAQSGEAGATIRAMVDGIGNTAQMALQIAVTSQQQLVGMDQISIAMENIRQAGEQNVNGVKQVELTIRNLHELGQRLKLTVGKFKM